MAASAVDVVDRFSKSACSQEVLGSGLRQKDGGNILLAISRNYRTARLLWLPVGGTLANVQAQLCDTGKRTCGAIAWCRNTCCGKKSRTSRVDVHNACERFGSAGFRKPSFFPRYHNDMTVTVKPGVNHVHCKWPFYLFVITGHDTAYACKTVTDAAAINLARPVLVRVTTESPR